VSQASNTADQGPALLALYDTALPQVYGYLVRRCDGPAVAEDLTAETFLAAVAAVQKGTVPSMSTAWLIGVARHKLVDHWRRTEREERKLGLVHVDEVDDPWDAELDAAVAHEVLSRLTPNHRSVLVLRYLDGLSVPEISGLIGRTVGATEVLLVRARKAFRAAYEAGSEPAPTRGGDPS
jgi:RNA polymerase sigma-70 factor (ECF subfamily)